MSDHDASSDDQECEAAACAPSDTAQPQARFPYFRVLITALALDAVSVGITIVEVVALHRKYGYLWGIAGISGFLAAGLSAWSGELLQTGGGGHHVRLIRWMAWTGLIVGGLGLLAAIIASGHAGDLTDG